jgi:hypothetical protein
MMTELTVVPDGTISLDEYRNRRVAEGTWPPTESAIEYWSGRRNMGMQQPKPAPEPPPRRKV